MTPLFGCRLDPSLDSGCIFAERKDGSQVTGGEAETHNRDAASDLTAHLFAGGAGDHATAILSNPTLLHRDSCWVNMWQELEAVHKACCGQHGEKCDGGLPDDCHGHEATDALGRSQHTACAPVFTEFYTRCFAVIGEDRDEMADFAEECSAEFSCVAEEWWAFTPSVLNRDQSLKCWVDIYHWILLTVSIFGLVMVMNLAYRTMVKNRASAEKMKYVKYVKVEEGVDEFVPETEEAITEEAALKGLQLQPGDMYYELEQDLPTYPITEHYAVFLVLQKVFVAYIMTGVSGPIAGSSQRLVGIVLTIISLVAELLFVYMNQPHIHWALNWVKALTILGVVFSGMASAKAAYVANKDSTEPFDNLKFLGILWAVAAVGVLLAVVLLWAAKKKEKKDKKVRQTVSQTDRQTD